MGVANKDKEHVQEFCGGISDNIEPVYLDTPGEQDGLLDCFVNVEKRIAESGGSVQYGWRIWEWSNTMIEAEFHAVWASPDGTLIDVTPVANSDRRILFLPDFTTQYEGRQVNNIRRALFTNPMLAEFINLADERFGVLK